MNPEIPTHAVPVGSPLKEVGWGKCLRGIILFTTISITMLITGGCTSSGEGLFGWYSAREARAADASAKARDDARDELVISARSEVAKAAQSVRAADQQHLPVQLTRRFIDNALPALDQVAGPMTAAEAAELRALVEDLLDGKEAAERNQRQAERQLENVSERLAGYERRHAADQERLRAAFDRENRLANRFRMTVLVSVGTGALSLLAMGAAWYFRSQGAGLIRTIGNSLRDLDQQNPRAAQAATGAFDVNLPPSLHQTIRKIRVS